MDGHNYTPAEMMAIMTCKEFKDWENVFVGIGFPWSLEF